MAGIPRVSIAGSAAGCLPPGIAARQGNTLRVTSIGFPSKKKLLRDSQISRYLIAQFPGESDGRNHAVNAGLIQEKPYKWTTAGWLGNVFSPDDFFTSTRCTVVVRRDTPERGKIRRLFVCMVSCPVSLITVPGFPAVAEPGSGDAVRYQILLAGTDVMFRNTEYQYGYLTVAAHWLTALIIVVLFILGLWMVTLDYYNPWYVEAPNIHRSLGVLLGVLVLFRLLLRFFMPVPNPAPGVKRWEHITAVIVHWLLYGLLLTTIVLGYLMSSADGRGVSVFGWFEVPATLTSIPDQADVAGELHYYFAVTLLVMAGIHALAAFKHHFIDRDTTLLRMLGKGR